MKQTVIAEYHYLDDGSEPIMQGEFLTQLNPDGYWVAVREWDLGCLQGHGKTRDEAIAELLELEAERDWEREAVSRMNYDGRRS